MSSILFLTSNKKIDLEKYNLKNIEKTEFLIKEFPYLIDKNYIYDFSDFNNCCSKKDFINGLISLLDEDLIITFVNLWQTSNQEEIENLNSFKENQIIINQFENYDNKFELIYNLENETNFLSTEFIFSNI